MASGNGWGVDGGMGVPSVVLKGALQMASSSEIVLLEATLQTVVSEVEREKEEMGSPILLCTIPPKPTSKLTSDWVLKKVEEL